jgi:opine dehydrogenase
MSSPQKTVYEALATSDLLRPVSGPNSLQHRYITEDVPYGLVPYVSIGGMLGIDMPITRAFVDLACAVNEVDYWASGRTVEKLHIAGLDAHRLSEFLRTGKM